MDENNHKLKTVIKMHKGHMAVYAAHTTNKSTHILTTQKNKTRATQKSQPFRNWRFRIKRGQENGPKAEKDKTEIATGLGRRTREEI